MITLLKVLRYHNYQIKEKGADRLCLPNWARGLHIEQTLLSAISNPEYCSQNWRFPFSYCLAVKIGSLLEELSLGVGLTYYPNRRHRRAAAKIPTPLWSIQKIAPPSAHWTKLVIKLHSAAEIGNVTASIVHTRRSSYHSRESSGKLPGKQKAMKTPQSPLI